MFFNRKGGMDGTNNFLNSISKFGVIVFFVTVVISLLFLYKSHYFLTRYAVYTALGIAFVVTFIFEFIYNLFRNKPYN